MSDPRLDLGPGLSSASADACQAALDSIRPVILIPSDPTPTEAVAAAALAHLVAPIHPHLEVDGDGELPPNPWGAATIGAAVDVGHLARPEASCDSDRTITIAIGDRRNGDWHIGGDDYSAAFAHSPVPASPGLHGLGLQAAAAFASAELLKEVLGPLGFVQHPALPGLTWNLLDFRNVPAPAISRPRLSKPSLWLLGAGSIGSSVGALCTILPTPGAVAVVDGDTFDPVRNPYRYPAATPSTTGEKAVWVAGMLAGAGWEVEAHVGDVASWVQSRPAPGHDGIVVSSVDRVDARADVADALARTTLSVGVGGLAFHVQREVAGSGHACPYCQYLAVGTPLNQAAAWAEVVGLPVERVIALVQGEALTEADLAGSVAAGRIAADRAAELVGRRLEDLIRRAYAQATVPADLGAAVAVSAPSVSWLAAVIAVAEIDKATVGAPALSHRVELDLSGVPTGAVRTLPRDRSGRCLCASPFRRRALDRLYGGV